MRRRSLLLALAACNPASTPTASDAAAWRDVIDLGACRHQIALRRRRFTSPAPRVPA